MKNQPIVSLSLLGLVLLGSCAKKNEPELVKETVIETISAFPALGGATMNGNIKVFGTTGIQTVGFIYSDESDPNVDNGITANLGTLTTTSTYSLDVWDYFNDSYKFYVKAYARTNDGKLIYGQVVQFIGQGGGTNPPVITSLTPTSGNKGTIITLSGRYFDVDETHNFASLAGQSLEIVQATMRKLAVKVPDNIPLGDVNLPLSVRVRITTISTPSNFHLSP